MGNNKTIISLLKEINSTLGDFSFADKDGAFISDYSGYTLSEEFAYPISLNTFMRERPIISINNDDVTIFAYQYAGNNYLKDVVLPNCSTIQKYAFAECLNLYSITISNNCNINALAFTNCTSLEKIMITANLDTDFNNSTSTNYYLYKAGMNAKRHFYSESTQKEILQLLTSAKSTVIYEGVFAHSNKNVLFIIPSIVTTILKNAFANCEGNKIIFGDSLISWCGKSFSNEGSTPLNYTLQTNDYTLPDANGNIVLPENVTTLTKYCLYNLKGNLLYIGNNITQIALYALPYLVQNVTWDNTLMSLTSSNSFFKNMNFTTLTLGNTCTLIKDFLCYDNKSVTNINIHNNIWYLGKSAFYGCTKLIEFIAPKIILVSTFSFYGCKKLKKVDLRSVNESTEGTGYLSLFYNCSSLEYVNLEQTTILGSSMFNGCKNLIELHIGKGFSNNINFATSSYNPSEAYSKTSSSLVLEGESFTNNNEKWNHNLREYFAANLPVVTNKTITFGSIVLPLISEETIESFSEKGWTLA